MTVLKSITFAYNPREDRILAAINPGRPEAWSCWLTRRLVLALIQRGSQFVASASPVVQRAAPEMRRQLAAFEHEAAIAKTVPSMTHTPNEVMKSVEPSAALAERVSVAHQGENLRIELRGAADGGGGAEGVLTRAEFQRVLQMLQQEVIKSGWLAQLAAPGTAAQPAPKPASKPPVRH